MLIAAVGVLRLALLKPLNGHAEARQAIQNQTIYLGLLLSYTVLPTVASLQFKSLACETLNHDGSSYLREDSSIECGSLKYQQFRAVVIIGICVYQSIPLVWYVLLWRLRRDLNPQQTFSSSVLLRKKKHHLRPYYFLFSDYIPSMWAFEVYEMYRYAI